MRRIPILALFLFAACAQTPPRPDPVPAEPPPVVEAAPPPATPELKVVEPLSAVCRDGQGAVAQAAAQFRELYDALRAQNAAPVGAPLALFFDPLNFDPRNARYKLCVPVARDAGFADAAPYKAEMLPGGLMAWRVHKGAYGRAGETYSALLAGLVGFEVVGPSREVYLIAPVEGKESPEDGLRTEIQFPVVQTAPAPAPARSGPPAASPSP